ncbi:heavy metal sensor histidine kinase [Ottowia thiooxydans]|uniref:heavy metal sensor histidine kinase n=1 Tax=Ottowia thiooxydans TaxID=219182 RepID=UPI0006872579|nr:heavy metal sensor histidine kinase [Ottowia thiooxydans]
MNRFWVRSLRGRLSLWLGLQSLAGLAMVCGVVYAATVFAFDLRQTQTLEEKRLQLGHLLQEPDGNQGDVALRHRLDDFLLGNRELSLKLWRADGSLFYEHLLERGELPHRVAPFAIESRTSQQIAVRGELGLDTRSDHMLLQRIALAMALAVLGGCTLISAGGYWLVRQGLKPVRQLIEQTRLLTADTLHQRLDATYQPEELAPLITQFNQLLERLEGAYEHLESFNADVAHELRTPLANLMGETELALRKSRGAEDLREVLGSNLEELHRITSIVQDMLFLSQADRGSLARRESVKNLHAVATKLAEYHEAALEEAQLALRVEGDAAGAFDIALIERALSNLLSNATRHAEPETTVRVEITTHQDQVTVQVVNHGATIAPEHISHLFDRFYRVETSRTGAASHHGLGLAIVAAVARMHGGGTFARSEAGLTTIGFTLSMSDEVKPSHGPGLNGRRVQ